MENALGLLFLDHNKAASRRIIAHAFKANITNRGAKLHRLGVRTLQGGVRHISELHQSTVALFRHHELAIANVSEAFGVIELNTCAASRIERKGHRVDQRTSLGNLHNGSAAVTRKEERVGVPVVGHVRSFLAKQAAGWRRRAGWLGQIVAANANITGKVNGGRSADGASETRWLSEAVVASVRSAQGAGGGNGDAGARTGGSECAGSDEGHVVRADHTAKSAGDGCVGIAVITLGGNSSAGDREGLGGDVCREAGGLGNGVVASGGAGERVTRDSHCLVSTNGGGGHCGGSRAREGHIGGVAGKHAGKRRCAGEADARRTIISAIHSGDAGDGDADRRNNARSGGDGGSGGKTTTVDQDVAGVGACVCGGGQADVHRGVH